jgi:hypothetical protein
MALVEVSATSAGLTTVTTAYTSGDMLGTIWSFTSAVATSGGYGYVVGAVLEDDSSVIGAVDIVLFNATVTQAANNAAASWSDADAALSVGSITLPYPKVYALNRIASWEGAKPFKVAATTLFAGMITRSDHTFFGATTALHCKLYIDQQ